MGFNKRKNCGSCGHPLHLQDLKESQWDDDTQNFIFVCSACNSNNSVKFDLFNYDGHVNRRYLAILKDDKDYLSGERLTRFFAHVDACDNCKARLNEEYIAEVEEKIKFNEKSLLYLVRHAEDVFQDVTAIYENSHIKRFSFKGDTYEINEDDEFYRDEGDRLQICYYLRNDKQCLMGMVCFSIGKKEKIILEKIWFRTEENLKKEQELFRLLKEGKIKLRLETIEKIFQTLHD